MSTNTLMTVEEFAHMNSYETEDYELVEGEIVPLPSATPIHAAVCQNVALLVGLYFRQNRIGIVSGEVYCRLADGNIRRPDLFILLVKNLQQIDAKRTPIPCAPDIAVQVLSPSEIAIGVHRKVRDYLAAGSKEVWILDQENGELFVHTPPAGTRVLLDDAVLELPLLPGFNAPVRELLTGF